MMEKRKSEVMATRGQKSEEELICLVKKKRIIIVISKMK